MLIEYKPQKVFLIKCFKESTQFFFKESDPFMKGTSRIKYYLRFPIAYIKYIYYMLTYQYKINKTI